MKLLCNNCEITLKNTISPWGAIFFHKRLWLKLFFFSVALRYSVSHNTKAMAKLPAISVYLCLILVEGKFKNCWKTQERYACIVCLNSNVTKVYSKKSLVKSSQNNFTWILPDYVSHEISKEFWKSSHFQNMRAGFLRRCQNSLRQNSHEMMHFQAWKKKCIWLILCPSFWSN